MALLAGLRVLDFSLNQVGAQASQLLADFGAEVIMVEPAGGSPLRNAPAFPFWCRGKKSITLDLRKDKATILDLAKSADVVIECARPGKMAALGLGYADLARDNPGLVYCSISGFGSKGPYAEAPGYEGLVAARLGLFHSFGAMRPLIDGVGISKKPAFVSTPFAGFAATQVALQGIFAALHERERSGRGQHVEASLGLALLAHDTWAWIEHILASRWPDAFSLAPNFDAAGRPLSPMMFRILVAQTSDGDWLQFASTAPRLYNAMIKALGLEGLRDDPDYANHPAFEDPDASFRFWTMMLDSAKSQTMDDWNANFDADHDVFAEQFRAGSSILEHEQLIHDGMTVTLDDKERGAVRQPGPLTVARSSPAELHSAPLLDEHRDTILAKGWSGGRLPVPPAAPDAPARLPLEGVTIVEFAAMFAAPQGTALMTELGARVIKIEPLEGDPIRSIITIPESGSTRVMQGKESICLDLSKPEGRAIALDLASKADVVLQGFRGNVVTRLGIDFEAVKARNPRIIYLNAPGYGVTGPYAHRPAYAPSIAAAAGFPLTNLGFTTPQRQPLRIDDIRPFSRRLVSAGSQTVAQADGVAATVVGTTIAFALYARDRGAGAQELFTSMLNSGVHMNSAVAVNWEGAPPAPQVDASLNGFGSLYRLYESNDGHIFLAAMGGRDWAKLCDVLRERIDLAADPRFTDESARHQHADALQAALQAVFEAEPALYWEELLMSAGIGCVQVAQSPTEAILLDTELGRDSGYIATVVDPTWDEMDREAALVRFSRSLTQAMPSCTAGQHSDAVLRELGIGEEELARLREAKIVA